MSGELKELEEYVANLDDYVFRLEAGESLPPVNLSCGYTMHSRRRDTILYLIHEIFVRRGYTGNGFYDPRPSDVVLDCGAHIGVFCTFLSSLAPGIRIHCFEPARQSRATLERNLRTNGLESSISVHPFALSSAGSRRLLQIGAQSGHTSLLNGEHVRPISTQWADCITLQQAVQLCRAPRIDLLKIDAEGSEADIVRSATRRTWARIARVAVEFHNDICPGNRDFLVRHLQRLGFDIVDIDTAHPFKESTGIIRAAQRTTV